MKKISSSTRKNIIMVFLLIDVILCLGLLFYMDFDHVSDHHPVKIVKKQ